MSELVHTATPPAAATPTATPERTRARRRARQRRVWIRRGLLALLGLAALFGLVWAFLPEPVPVDAAVATRGPMQVSVVDDGRTRVVHRYVVSAPVAGRLSRITLRPGDAVEAGTELTRVTPAASPLLDPRTRAEAGARVDAARARLRQAEATVARARSIVDHSASEARRLRTMARAGVTAEQDAIQAEYQAHVAAEELAAAEYGARVAEREVAAARAVLAAGPAAASGGYAVPAPVAGRVLRVLQESETVVAAGTPLVEIGDSAVLEVVADVLSRDAVRLRPGARAWIEQWGGDRALPARVRRIEPSAFTRVSALGIEEQRVNIIIAFDEPAGASALGDGYRVEARIVEWEATDVLRVPASAVYRTAAGWGVYRIDDGRARGTAVTIGRRNEDLVEITGGLDAGARVILHPSDRIAEAVRVAPRGD